MFAQFAQQFVDSTSLETGYSRHQNSRHKLVVLHAHLNLRSNGGNAMNKTNGTQFTHTNQNQRLTAVRIRKSSLVRYRSIVTSSFPMVIPSRYVFIPSSLGRFPASSCFAFLFTFCCQKECVTWPRWLQTRWLIDRGLYIHDQNENNVSLLFVHSRSNLRLL